MHESPGVSISQTIMAIQYNSAELTLLNDSLKGVGVGATKMKPDDGHTSKQHQRTIQHYRKCAETVTILLLSGKPQWI